MNFTLTIDKKQVGKILGYLLVITGYYILFGARGVAGTFNFVTINAMPFLVAAIAFADGPYTAGWMGLYAGLLQSVSSATLEGVEAAVLALFGILCGSVGLLFMRRILPSVLFCGSLMLVLRGLFSATYYTLFYAIPFVRVAAAYLGVLAASLIPGAVGYFLIGAVHNRFSKDEV